MLRVALRGVKSIFNVRLNLVTVFTIVTIAIFITVQVLESSNDCTLAPLHNRKERRFHNNLDPKVLNELKRQWMLEYEEEKRLNANENKVEEDLDQSKLRGKFSMQSSAFLPIDCSINGDKIIDCLRGKETEEIFMPWNFIKTYFDVYGKIVRYEGYDRFEFQQSYSEVFYDPKHQYRYDGVFLTFETYNVETRDRVKLVTGLEGVPLSTQWGPKGYFYPIQIAQFAMSHYSKNITENPPIKTVYEDGETSRSKWTPANSHCSVKSVFDQERNSKVLKFQAPVSLPLGQGMTLTLGNTVECELSLDIKFLTRGSLTVVVDANDKKRYKIHYLTDGKELIDFDGDRSVTYKIGSVSGWRHFARDLKVDLRKGIGKTNTKAVKKVRTSINKVVSLTLQGEGFIDNVAILTAEHMTHFLAGSYWLLNNQNNITGGWPVMIERRFEGCEPLAPGWHSAMAQGHGLSTMVRAYRQTKDPKFLKALRLALQPYTIPSIKGGVRAVFMEKYVWFEEYPTNPSSFVLNGFIYSLLGLYDYKMLMLDVRAEKSLSTEDEYALSLVTDLFHTGMMSLKSMLPLYDAGFTTIYDLRHFQLKTQPNLARWDYHATHISQIALLSTIDDDPIFKDFYRYWMGYTKGIRAKHN